MFIASEPSGAMDEHDRRIIRLMFKTMNAVRIMLASTPNSSNSCAWMAAESVTGAMTLPFIAPPNAFPHTTTNVPTAADLDWTNNASIALDETWRLGVIQALDWSGSGFDREIGRSLFPPGPASKGFILPLSGVSNSLYAIGRDTSRLDSAPSPFSCTGGPFWEQRYSGGSGTPFHVALDPAGGPPEVHVMPVIGSTEIYNDSRRYKAAVKFARREFIALATSPLLFDPGWPSVIKP
jgi:hypothetical protein